MNDTYFEATSKLGKRIHVTNLRWELIIKTKHLEIEGKVLVMIQFSFITNIMENHWLQLLQSTTTAMDLL